MGGTQCALATAGPLVLGDLGGQYGSDVVTFSFWLRLTSWLRLGCLQSAACLGLPVVRNVFRAPVVTSWTTIDLDKVGKRSLQSRSVGQGRVAFSKPKKNPNLGIGLQQHVLRW